MANLLPFLPFFLPFFTLPAIQVHVHMHYRYVALPLGSRTDVYSILSRRIFIQHSHTLLPHYLVRTLKAPPSITKQATVVLTLPTYRPPCYLNMTSLHQSPPRAIHIYATGSMYKMLHFQPTVLHVVLSTNPSIPSSPPLLPLAFTSLTSPLRQIPL